MLVWARNKRIHIGDLCEVSVNISIATYYVHVRAHTHNTYVYTYRLVRIYVSEGVYVYIHTEVCGCVGPVSSVCLSVNTSTRRVYSG